MHELSLCSAIADTVAGYAGGRTVSAVRVRIGSYRQVVPDTLAFCWDVQVGGTDLDGCKLLVDTVPAVVRCRSCGEDTTLDVPLLLCSACDGANVDLVSGEEFLIDSIDVVAVTEDVS